MINAEKSLTLYPIFEYFMISVREIRGNRNLLHLTIKQAKLLNEGHVPSLDLLSRRRVATREVEAVEIVLQKQRLEVCQRVLVTKDSPYTFL